jgi:phosphopantothenoylcysteine decarboxylase/phosphopantothenate--cysteine ligase
MHAAVMEALPRHQIVIKAAAVADYAPREVSAQKIKKSGESLSVTLARNPDILGNLAGVDLPGLVRIGFAAETQDLVDNARDKLKKKKLDMIVANDAVASIGAESSALTLMRKDGTIEQLPPLPKEESARLIVARLAAMLGQET